MLLTFATPLGFRIVLAPLRTAQSLSLFREQVDEFHRIWTIRTSRLALATGLPAAWALWRTRRTTPLFDWGVWLLSLGAGPVGGARADVLCAVSVASQRCVRARTRRATG